MRTIPHIGCNGEEFFVSSQNLNSILIYDEEPEDLPSPLCPNDVTYGSDIPVQAVTFLNQEMHSVIYQAKQFISDATVEPTNPNEYYNYLNAIWRDGTPLSYGGTGYNPNSTDTVKFAFPDRPDDPQGWTLQTANLPIAGRSILANHEVGTFPPGGVIEIDLGYTTYQDSSLFYFNTADLVYQNTPLLQQMYNNGFSNSCILLNTADLTVPQLEIFPNPTTHSLNIKMENISNVDFTIFDIYGKNVFQQNEITIESTNLNISHLSNGIYFLKIKMGGKEWVEKFVKL